VQREMLLRVVRTLALYLFWPAVALVVWGELARDQSTLQVEALAWDKALHFIAYFGLSGLVCLALRDGRRVLVAAISLILFAGALEIVQGWVGRDMDVFDELANALGVLCGTAAGFAVIWLLSSKTLAATRKG